MAMQIGGTYRNPVWGGGTGDPFVLKVRGRYYMYATEGKAHPDKDAWVFPILTSTDLVNWHEVGKAMQGLGEGYFFYWAPEVTEYNGQFLLYYAVHRQGEFAGGIRVAVAERPEGPFVDSGHNLTGHLVPWAIDPHVFRDQDGQWYLYVTIEYLDGENGFVGSGNAVVRLADPLTTTGELARVTRPGREWQLFEAKRQEKGGIDWYTVEGPTLVRYRRRYYEMFSGGCYYRDNYAVSYATATEPMGQGGIEDGTWRDSERFVLRGTPELIGPGHNSLVYGPNNVEQYIVYHAWQADMKERRPCIDRLFWQGEEMWSAAPTSTEQVVPAEPRLRELFEGSQALHSWQEQGGEWRVKDGEVVQHDGQVERAALMWRERLSDAWLLEVNLRSGAGDGEYGIELSGDDGRWVRIVVSRDGEMTVRASEVAEMLATVQLARTFRMEAWQQIRLMYSGRMLTVHFEWLELFAVELPLRPERFALLTERVEAGFSGISLTDHFCDQFLDADCSLEQLGWQVGSGSGDGWWIERDVLVQSEVGGEQSLLKGSYLEQSECGVNVRLTGRGEGEACMGMALEDGGTRQVEVLLCEQAGRWRLRVRGKGVEQVIALPLEFEAGSWHTLRVVARQDGVSIYLDGPQVCEVQMVSGAVRLALVSAGAAVEFMGVWQTGM